MNHKIEAGFDRALNPGSGKGVIGNGNNLVFARRLRDFFEIDDLKQWVARSFNPNHARVWSDRGSHVVVSDDLYGGTFRLFEKVRRRSANLDFTYIDMSDASKIEAAMRPNTRMVWVETPSNPLLKLIDLEAVAKIARVHKAISVSDNT